MANYSGFLFSLFFIIVCAGFVYWGDVFNHSTFVEEGRRQLCGVSSLLPALCGF